MDNQKYFFTRDSSEKNQNCPKKFVTVELHAYLFMQNVYLLSLSWKFVKDFLSVAT